MADLAPPLPITSRSPASIQVDIDRTVARLRALRTRQANAHFVDRPGLAAQIQVLQDELDQLFEEKRAAHLPPRHYHSGRKRSSGARHGRQDQAALVASQVFGNP